MFISVCILNHVSLSNVAMFVRIKNILPFFSLEVQPPMDTILLETGRSSPRQTVKSGRLDSYSGSIVNHRFEPYLGFIVNHRFESYSGYLVNHRIEFYSGSLVNHSSG